MFKPKRGNPTEIGTAVANRLREVNSVVLTEAKTMYAGGSSQSSTMWYMQIHTMAYNTGTGLYSQTDWFTNSGFSFAISKLVLEEIGAPPTTSYLYYLSFVKFEVYTKTSLSQVGVPLAPIGVPNMEAYTLVQGPSEGNKFFLAHQTKSNVYNFQSYYIQFDLCTGRAGGQHLGGICPSCPTGYYLSEVSVANNQCYPDGWKTTKGNLTLVPCADTNCLECPTSSTVCRKCKQTPTQYWSQGTDPTTCVTTAPASRFGIDSTGFKYVACSDANCLNCAASNTVCTGCDVANGWYLDGTVCKTKAQ